MGAESVTGDLFNLSGTHSGFADSQKVGRQFMGKPPSYLEQRLICHDGMQGSEQRAVFRAVKHEFFKSAPDSRFGSQMERDRAAQVQLPAHRNEFLLLAYVRPL